MRTFDIHEAKKHLSWLVDEAAHGAPFIIARDGKPLVRVMALTVSDTSNVRRLGFMPGIVCPEDFDTMDAVEIRRMFECDE